MSLCKYANLFGQPNQGAHAYRVFGIAAVDLGATVALSLFFKDKLRAFILLMVTSLVVHKACCVHTTLTDAVFSV